MSIQSKEEIQHENETPIIVTARLGMISWPDGCGFRSAYVIRNQSGGESYMVGIWGETKDDLIRCINDSNSYRSARGLPQVILNWI